MRLSQYLIEKKGYPKNFRIPQAFISENSDIESIASDIYSIYTPSYPKTKIQRLFHGFSHWCRVAYLIRVLSKLYERYGEFADYSQDEFRIFQKKIKLLQVAGLLHDAGRETDDKDALESEQASGTIAFYYLFERLGVDYHTAKEMAEAIVNKEFAPGEKYYYCQMEEQSGVLVWSGTPEFSKTKTIYQKLLHDADCLDVIRVRPVFYGWKLDLFNDYIEKDIAESRKTYRFSKRLLELLKLENEVRSLIEYCGDTYLSHRKKSREAYNKIDGYQLIVKLVTNDRSKEFPLLSQLYLTQARDEQLVSIDVFPIITSEMSKIEQVYYGFYRQVDENHPILACRVVTYPSAVHEKWRPPYGGGEPNAINYELSLMDSREGYYPGAQNGNPLRSVSFYYPGTEMYHQSATGFLSILDNYKSADNIFTKGNGNSGFGEKSENLRLTSDELREAHRGLKETVILGGPSNKSSAHTEALVTLSKREAEAIYLDEDDVDALIADERDNKNIKSLVNILVHHYLHESNKRHYARMKAQGLGEGLSESLPVYSLSRLHDRILPYQNPTDEQIFKIWKILIQCLHHHYINDIDEFFVKICYGSVSFKYSHLDGEVKINPLFEVYSEALQEKIKNYANIRLSYCNLSFGLNANLVNRYALEQSYMENSNSDISGKRYFKYNRNNLRLYYDAEGLRLNRKGVCYKIEEINFSIENLEDLDFLCNPEIIIHPYVRSAVRSMVSGFFEKNIMGCYISSEPLMYRLYILLAVNSCLGGGYDREIKNLTNNMPTSWPNIEKPFSQIIKNTLDLYVMLKSKQNNSSKLKECLLVLIRSAEVVWTSKEILRLFSVDFQKLFKQYVSVTKDLFWETIAFIEGSGKNKPTPLHLWLFECIPAEFFGRYDCCFNPKISKMPIVGLVERAQCCASLIPLIEVAVKCSKLDALIKPALRSQGEEFSILNKNNGTDNVLPDMPYIASYMRGVKSQKKISNQTLRISILLIENVPSQGWGITFRDSVDNTDGFTSLLSETLSFIVTRFNNIGQRDCVALLDILINEVPVKIWNLKYLSKQSSLSDFLSICEKLSDHRAIESYLFHLLRKIDPDSWYLKDKKNGSRASDCLLRIVESYPTKEGYLKAMLQIVQLAPADYWSSELDCHIHESNKASKQTLLQKILYLYDLNPESETVHCAFLIAIKKAPVSAWRRLLENDTNFIGQFIFKNYGSSKMPRTLAVLSSKPVSDMFVLKQDDILLDDIFRKLIILCLKNSDKHLMSFFISSIRNETDFRLQTIAIRIVSKILKEDNASDTVFKTEFSSQLSRVGSEVDFGYQDETRFRGVVHASMGSGIFAPAETQRVSHEISTESVKPSAS